MKDGQSSPDKRRHKKEAQPKCDDKSRVDAQNAPLEIVKERGRGEETFGDQVAAYDEKPSTPTVPKLTVPKIVVRSSRWRSPSMISGE